MSLQLYAFSAKTFDLELMVRANSRSQAQTLFDSYISQMNTATSFTLALGKHIPTGSLSTSGFSTPGAINGGNTTTPGITGTSALFLDHETAPTPLCTTPDSTENSITGDLTIIVCMQLLNYEASHTHVLIDKQGSGDIAYVFELANATALRSIFSAGGLFTDVNTTSTGAVSEGQHKWVRITFNASTSYDFYTSSDPVKTALTDISWNEIATFSTSTSSIHDSAAEVRVGDIHLGNIAYFWRVALINSTNPNAAPVVDMYPERDYVEGNSWVSETGETWTLINGATVVQT